MPIQKAITDSNPRLAAALAVSVIILIAGPSGAWAESGWEHFGGSTFGQQYSPLTQIEPGNVAQLQVEWTYRTGELGEGSSQGFAFQANPILVDERLFITTGSGIVIALDPADGAEIWRFDPALDRSRPTAEIANRGVTAWRDPDRAATAACRLRVFTGTLDARLIALDGETGQLCEDFGEDGTVRLDEGVRLVEEEWVNYLVTSPPVVVDDILVIGTAIGDNRGVELELGIVRGIDARTGVTVWRWDPIPRNPEDPAHGSWKPDQVQRTGAANAWAPLAADAELGLVYVPTGSASPDFYGGERVGANLYANSLVALRAATGELVWYQQLVHHDLWDYDLAAQPTLVDLQRGQQTIPAVIQGTKTGLLFTFNRETGEPIFEIQERPVPQGAVAGETPARTQPFPVAPPPLVRQGPVTPDDAWGLLLFDKWACRKELTALRSDGIYTPPSLEGTIVMPFYGGGINWGGVAWHPNSQTAVVNAMDIPAVVQLIPRDEAQAVYESGKYPNSQFSRMSGTPYGMRRETLLSPLGVPCVAPPWGTLAAIDLAAGTIRWQVPLGTIEDTAPSLVPNFRFGVPNIGGPIITASGLVFIAAAMDDYLRAFDLMTGTELWKGRLPAGGQATPMTYYLAETDRQYVVIAAGGHPRLSTTLGDYLVAFSLKAD